MHAATKKPSIGEGGRFTTTLQEHLKKGGLSTFKPTHIHFSKNLNYEHPIEFPQLKHL